MQIKCVACGKIFKRKPCLAVKPKPHYCSKQCFYKSKTRNERDRFWGHVNKTNSCWLWTGFRDKDGYGSFWSEEAQSSRAPRVSWTYANGPIPDGLHVLHNCPGGDNPACVNPAHLFLGTNLTNCIDASRKGRKRKGEDNAQHVYTEKDVRELRERFKKGETVSSLARLLGRSRYGIWAIVHRITWRHVT